MECPDCCVLCSILSFGIPRRDESKNEHPAAERCEGSDFTREATTLSGRSCHIAALDCLPSGLSVDFFWEGLPREMEHCIEGNVAELKPCIACDEATIGINFAIKDRIVKLLPKRTN